MINYVCKLHEVIGSQDISYHSLMHKIIRDSGHAYKRGCRLCHLNHFKNDIQDNHEKYYGNRKLFKINIDECKRRFEEKRASFIDGQYKGDKHYYYFRCKHHLDKGIQKKQLNDLINPKVKFACRFCGIESRSKQNSYLWKGGKTPENEQIRLFFASRKCRELQRKIHRLAALYFYISSDGFIEESAFLRR